MKDGSQLFQAAYLAFHAVSFPGKDKEFWWFR